MRADMLLHIVLASKGLVANGAMYALLARVLLAVAGCVAGRRERSGAAMARGIGAWILVLASSPPRRASLR